MLNEIKKDAQARMGKSIDALRHALVKVRTGRANAGLVDSIKVSYYGSEMPLSQVASVAVTDARSITITPWEKQMVGPVEKAILGSDLGLTPTTAGTVIRLNIPALTEERRKDLAKVVHSEGEDAKVAIRNIRRDANTQVKGLLKEKQITEDEASGAEADIQKITDGAIKDVDEVIRGKEVEHIIPNDIIRVDFRLGFRMEPRINLMFRKVVEDLVANKEVNIISRYESLASSNTVGDFQFMVMEKYLSQDNELPFIERVIMKFHFWLKEHSLSEEKGFGLDAANVTVEKFPLIVAPVTNLKLKRIED